MEPGPVYQAGVNVVVWDGLDYRVQKDRRGTKAGHKSQRILGWVTWLLSEPERGGPFREQKPSDDSQ